MAGKIAAGNWKMNGLQADLGELATIAAAPTNCQVLICPPAHLLLPAVAATGPRIAIGAQDCHTAPDGAHTGDLSAPMIADTGASHVIIGHSERRTDHKETDALIAAKLAAAQSAGLTPILCLGETLEIRKAGQEIDVVTTQFDAALPAEITDKLVIAYEPVWAIGTGVVATKDEIAAVHQHLRQLCLNRFGAAGADISLLYGGSVKASNAAQIFAIPDVDGALVGGASLKAQDFIPIVQALGAS